MRRQILSKILILLGLTVHIVGILCIPNPLLSFPIMASTMIFLGGALASLGLGLYLRGSLGDSLGEKLFIILICTSVIFETIALVLYLVVKVEWISVPVVVHVTKVKTEERIAVIPQIHHLYESISAILAFMCAMLVLLAFYVKKSLS